MGRLSLAVWPVLGGRTVPQRELADLGAGKKAPPLGRPQYDVHCGPHLQGAREAPPHSRAPWARTLLVLTCTNLVAKLVAGVLG